MYSRTVKELLIVTFLAVTFSACQKSTPVAVPALQEFRDSSNLFTMSVPTGWPESQLPGKLWLYNSNDAANRFFDPTSSSKAGVKIFAFADSAGAKTLDYIVQQFKDSLRTEQAQIDPDVQTTLAGNPAVKVPYALKIDSKNTVYSYRILTVVDSMVYGFEAAGFNNEFKRYSNVFDSVSATFRIIPKAVVKQQLPDNLIPSTTTSTYSNEYYSIQYPDNFKATPSGAAGDIKTSVSIKGYFEDCTLQIDVLDAKKLTVEKIFQQNKGNYPHSRSEKTKLDGLDAYKISYSPVRGIQREVYFVVKNNNWIRVILTWNEASQKKYNANFQQAFENAVATLKLK